MIMLGFMDRAEVVGYYSAAYRIFYVCLGLFSIWQTTAVPIATRRIHEDKEKASQFLTKYLRLTMIIFVPLVTLVSLAAPLIVGVVFGGEYSPATQALQVLIWTLLVITIGSTYGILILVPAGLFNEFLLAVLAGAAVNVILNFLLIPKFSMIGAAVATIFAELFAGAIAYSFAKKVLNLGLLASMIKPFIITCFTTMIFMLVIYLAPVNLYLKYSAAILIYVIAYAGIIMSVEKKYIFEFVNELIGKGIS
jgi:O-antigen/teichoic acid export membrane protein